jgi:hypothetical protein
MMQRKTAWYRSQFAGHDKLEFFAPPQSATLISQVSSLLHFGFMRVA